VFGLASSPAMGESNTGIRVAIGTRMHGLTIGHYYIKRKYTPYMRFTPPFSRPKR
jgi:hypothetical protein